MKNQTDRQRVNRALHNLRSRGFFVRIAWRKGREEAWEEANQHSGAAFYRKVDDKEAFNSGGQLTSSLFLKWKGNIGTIIGALRNQGFSVEWKGSKSDCIVVASDRMLKEWFPDASLSETKEIVDQRVDFLVQCDEIYNRLCDVLVTECDMSSMLSAVTRLHQEMQQQFTKDGEKEELDFIEGVTNDIVVRNKGEIRELEEHGVCENCAERFAYRIVQEMINAVASIDDESPVTVEATARSLGMLVNISKTAAENRGLQETFHEQFLQGETEAKDAKAFWKRLNALLEEQGSHHVDPKDDHHGPTHTSFGGEDYGT